MHVKDPGEPDDEEGEINEGGGTRERDRDEGKKRGRRKGPPQPGDPGYKPGPCKFPDCPNPTTHDGNLAKQRMRIERAKRQLRRLVKAFQKDVKFNLVRFSTDAVARCRSS